MATLDREPAEARAPAAPRELLELHGISKRFGAVQALTDVQFDVANVPPAPSTRA